MVYLRDIDWTWLLQCQVYDKCFMMRLSFYWTGLKSDSTQVKYRHGHSNWFEEFVIVHIRSYLVICKISVIRGTLNLSKDVTGNSIRLGTPKPPLLPDELLFLKFWSCKSVNLRSVQTPSVVWYRAWWLVYNIKCF